MANITSPTREIIRRLGDYLQQKMAFNQLILEWPEGNAQLKYPALSIFAGKLLVTPQAPTVFENVSPVANQGDILWQVGDFDLIIQLDLWCGSKEERHRLYEALFQAFHSMLPITGLSLTLVEYHDVFCRYDLVSHEYMDGEEQAQRKEWRIKASVLANCEAIVKKTENLVKAGEIVFDSYQVDSEITPITLE